LVAGRFMDEVLGGRARRYVHPWRCPTCPHELATAARAPRPHRRRDVLGSSLPRCRAPDASADQVDRGRLDRRCDHCCRFLAARWMGLVGDARAPGATGRVRLSRAPPARPGRPRGAARRAARRGPRHDAARAREPLAAGARKVMAVAGHPRILLRGIDRAELASILGALGDLTTDAALVADLVVFTATADESLAELRPIAAHDDGAWRPVL